MKLSSAEVKPVLEIVHGRGFSTRVECANLKILSRDSEPFRARMDVELPDIGLYFRDCVVTDHSVVQWIDLPGSRDGTPSAMLAEFTDEDKLVSFINAVLSSVSRARKTSSASGMS